MPFGFADLLHPSTQKEFLDEHWEQEPLYVDRRRADYYDGLLRFAEIDDLFSSADLKYPTVQLVSDGDYVHPSTYAHIVTYGHDEVRGVLSWGSIFDAFQTGTSIVINRMHDYVPSVRFLCDSSESQLGHTCHVNGYLSPPSSKGFAAHYDIHDVFVLQVFGTKKWKVYDPVVRLPDASQIKDIPNELGKPLDELTLRPGDLLYLPRGYVHAAETSSNTSLHLTLGVSPRTWVDVFRVLLADCENDVMFRSSLPAGTLLGNIPSESLVPTFSDLLKRFCERVDLDGAISRLVTNASVSKSIGVRPKLCYLLSLEELSLATIVRWVNVDDLPTIKKLSDSTVIQQSFVTLSVSHAATSSLEFMVDRSEFAVGDISGELDDSEKLSLVRKMTRAGWLEVYRPERPTV